MGDKRLWLSVGVLAFALGLCASGAQARIVRIEITRIESPTFEGRSFGDVGQYEKLVGRHSARSIRLIRETQ